MERGMRTLLVLVLAAVGLVSPAVGVQEGMKEYRLALLQRVPGVPSLGERQIQALQEMHLAYLDRLHDEGTVVVAGPLSRAGDLHSVLVLDVASDEEAEAILAGDSWVAAGRLKVEIHPWWADSNVLQRAPDRTIGSWFQLGLLKRPPGAPDYSEEKLREIQAGHMANLRKMADSGDLVLAGPTGDDGTLRGILVFRTSDLERIRELVAADPAVRAGRLGLELYPWRIPAGSLPGN